jgi:hypothetical protein
VVTGGNNSLAPAVVWILPGLGNGQFGSAIANVPLASQGLSPVVADFNGDGKPDFAVSDVMPGAATIQVGLQQTPSTYQLVSTSISLPLTIAWAGDLNGDGLPDLIRLDGACQNSPACGSVYAMLNTGSGAFGSPLLASFGGSNSAPGVAVADFNNDGIPDLAVGGAASCGNGSAVLLGNGDGTFGAPICLGAMGYGIATGDFNNDGNQDVAVASVNGGRLVYLGKGTGKFKALPEQNIQFIPTQLVTADFNGDGNLDLASINADGATIQVSRSR